ncbi:MAG: hypothetical protein WCD20_03010 [Rhodomicrobium sp.]
MKYAYKAAAAAFLFLAFASPAAAAAPGPVESILSAPFAITASLVDFAVSIPASLFEQPHRARHGTKARARVQRVAHHRRRHHPAYRFREPAEDL